MDFGSRSIGKGLADARFNLAGQREFATQNASNAIAAAGTSLAMHDTLGFGRKHHLCRGYCDVRGWSDNPQLYFSVSGFGQFCRNGNLAREFERPPDLNGRHLRAESEFSFTNIVARSLTNRVGTNLSGAPSNSFRKFQNRPVSYLSGKRSGILSGTRGMNMLPSFIQPWSLVAVNSVILFLSCDN